MSDIGVYDEHDDGAWRRVHANGERTDVCIIPVGDNYVALAVDTDPVDFEAGESVAIGLSRSRGDAEAHATRWMEQHPKGIESGGDGLGSKLAGMVGSLDQSKQQEEKGGDQA